MTFMIAVLGSIVFWLGYGFFSLVMVIITMEKIGLARRAYNIIVNNKKLCYARPPDSMDYFDAYCLFFTHLVFWPLIIIGFITFRIMKLVMKGIGKIMQAIEKAIPTITIGE